MKLDNKLIEIIIESEEDLGKIAEHIVSDTSRNVILLEGDLGAGKTTFVKKYLYDNAALGEFSSPTFSLVNEYESKEGDPIYHMDLYRLQTLEEALNIGIEDYLDSGNLCFIEWPKFIEEILEEDQVVKVKIKVLEGGKRSFTLS